MKISWLGHAAFRITSGNGTSIVTDPYEPATSGYAPYREPADVVIISSATDDFHNNTHLVPGNHETINALDLARTGEPLTTHGFTVTAIEAMEALSHRDFHPDQNGMARLVIDGVSIGHMGDMGNPLTDSHIAFFEHVDVLLALTGGFPTIPMPDLLTAIGRIQPKLVIPMHFRTLTYKPRSQFWIEEFLQHFPKEQVDFACDHEIELTPAKLPTSTRIMVLDYAR